MERQDELKLASLTSIPSAMPSTAEVIRRVSKSSSIGLGASLLNTAWPIVAALIRALPRRVVLPTRENVAHSDLRRPPDVREASGNAAGAHADDRTAFKISKSGNSARRRIIQPVRWSNTTQLNFKLNFNWTLHGDCS